MPKAEDYGIESVLEVLNQIGIEGHARGEEFGILCPNPHHEDSNPSTDVNLRTGFWSCFACEAGGDILDLVVMVTGKSRYTALQMLTPSSEDSIRVKVQTRRKRVTEATRGKLAHTSTKLPGPYEDGPHSYMRSRGLTQDTIRRWELRYVPEEILPGQEKRFVIRHSVAIPIKSRLNKLLAWCYRSTPMSPDWQPKYLYTKDVEISELWFGAQHHWKAEHIVVVEGAIDTMWLDQHGIPALGMLGSHMGERKLLDLTQFKSVTLFPDHDAAGAHWVRRIGKVIGDKVPLRVARYAEWMEGEDPAELPGIDLELALARAVPWHRFRRGTCA